MNLHKLRFHACVFRRLLSAVLLSWSGALLLAQGAGYWHTSGNQILDANNRVVRIAGVNWYGFETTDQVAHGLWAQDYHAILNAIKANGYNAVRIPFSNQMVESQQVPSNISYNNGSGPINTDLQGLTSLQILDKIINAAGAIELRVILDNHRSEAGNSAEQNGLWYTSAYPDSSWINDWSMLAQRYLNDTTVIGMDLRNEPHNAAGGGSCWGCGSMPNDWRLAAQRAGNAVLAINPNLLIFVEGTDCYNGACDWWGGNLEGAQAFPVLLNVAGRLVYSPHDYGPMLYGQNWFNGGTTYSSLVSVWTKFWAYLSLNSIAPVWVGEFGTTNNSGDIQNSAPGSQGQWFQGIVAFLQNTPAISWTYWALNGEDSYALLNSNYGATPVSALKQQMLSAIQSPLAGGSNCTASPSVPSGLNAITVSSSQIKLSWTAVTPFSGCGITYNIYSSTTSGFTISSSSRIATALSGTNFQVNGLQPSTIYYYRVTALDGAGESAASSQASAATSVAPACSSVPAAPGSLAAGAVSPAQINISWNAVSTPAGCSVSYNVYASLTSGFTPSSSNRIATGVPGTTYSSAGLQPSTAYFYIARAQDAAGESGNSNQASAATQSSGGGSCHVTYVVNGLWSNGFNTSIAIQNTGGSAINGWALTWTWPGSQQIYQAWNSNFTQTGQSATLTNATWNSAIAPGASVSGIGFNASYSGAASTPVAFFVNGARCN